METSQHPWRLDDEKFVYPFYERVAKAGIKNVCVHKGLFAPAVEQKYPRLRPYVDVSDVARPAKDFPQLNFVIYHAGFRYVGGFRAYRPHDRRFPMSPLRRMLTVSALALTAAIAPVQTANAALLDKYFADVNARDLPALKDVISENYVQHGAYQGQGLAGMEAAFQHDFEMFPDFTGHSRTASSPTTRLLSVSE